MNFFKATLYNGVDVCINPNLIIAVVSAGHAGSKIYSVDSNNDPWLVKETYTEVLKKIKEC